MRHLIGILIALSIFSVCYAEVPRTINYQGHLTGSGGASVNAAVDMTFTIYNAATSGTNLWTEGQTVQVNNGIYAVALGATNPINPAIIDGDLWLGVKVGADAEMTPRQKLNSVPFAMNASSISGLKEGDICRLFDSVGLPRPEACPKVGEANKKVFVSSKLYIGSGLHVGHDICQDLADSAGLEGNFKAWLGIQYSSPSDIFTRSTKPYVLLDGTVVANDWTDLVDGTLQNPINVMENGTVVGHQKVWTGTTQNGESNNPKNCMDFTERDSSGGYYSGVSGNTESIDVGWYQDHGTSYPSCGAKKRIYCFQQ